MKENKESIFMDKLSISMSYLHKCLSLITAYSDLQKKINYGIIKVSELDKIDRYQDIWQGIAELYMALEFRYVGKLIQNAKDKENQIEHERLIKIMEKYESLDKIKSLTFTDMKFALHTLRKILYLNGFDDVSVNKGSNRDFLAPTKEWNE